MMPVPTVATGASKVKFRLAGGAQPLVLVPVFVNGDGPHEFIFDTGAGTSLLTPELAQKLEIEITGSKEGHSAGGKVQAQLARVDSIAIGTAQQENLDVAIVDLGHVGRTIGARIDGDIGYNFSKHFRLGLDYRACELSIATPAVLDFGADRAPARADVKMHLAKPSKPLVLVAAHVNGRGPFQFAIDTGTSTCALAAEVARELGVSTVAIAPGTTGGAQVNVSSGQIQSLSIAAARLENIAVVVGDFLSMLSEVCGSRLDGIIGHNYLKHFRVTFDYPNERFLLQ